MNRHPAACRIVRCGSKCYVRYVNGLEQCVCSDRTRVLSAVVIDTDRASRVRFNTKRRVSEHNRKKKKDETWPLNGNLKVVPSSLGKGAGAILG